MERGESLKYRIILIKQRDGTHDVIGLQQLQYEHCDMVYICFMNLI